MPVPIGLVVLATAVAAVRCDAARFETLSVWAPSVGCCAAVLSMVTDATVLSLIDAARLANAVGVASFATVVWKVDSAPLTEPYAESVVS